MPAANMQPEQREVHAVTHYDRRSFMHRRQAVALLGGGLLTLFGISAGCSTGYTAQQLNDAAWQLYVQHDKDGGFRCARCEVMQPAGAELFWIDDATRVGDSLTTIRDAGKRWNSNGSGWCAACFTKLLRAGGRMPQPVRPAYVPPTADQVAEQKRRQEEQQKASAEYSAKDKKMREDLYWALRTRVLSDEEMAEVRSYDYLLLVDNNETYFEKDKKQEFNQALEQQARIRILAKEKQR